MGVEGDNKWKEVSIAFDDLNGLVVGGLSMEY